MKDHRYELPIKDIEWHMESDLVMSIDKKVCKIWDKNTVRLLDHAFYLNIVGMLIESVLIIYYIKNRHCPNFSAKSSKLNRHSKWHILRNVTTLEYDLIFNP